MIPVMMIMVLMILPREHNRVAAELAKMHPAWNDDKIYSEVMHLLYVVVIGVISYISTHDTFLVGFLPNFQPSRICSATFAHQARAVVIAEMQHITYRYCETVIIVMVNDHLLTIIMMSKAQ